MPSRSDEDATIRAATTADAAAIAEIYNHYITKTVVTFEEEPVAPSEIAQRMQVISAASLPWLVADRRRVLAAHAVDRSSSGGRVGFGASYRRPAVFALYIAASASRSISSGFSKPALDSAMPTLTLAKTSWPRTLIGATNSS